MTSSVRPIPGGYHSVTPYLMVDDAAGAIEFYKQAFGAADVMRMPRPDGKIGHAEVEISGSRIMLADEYPEMGFRGPTAIGSTPVSLHLYVEDVDALARQAVAAAPGKSGRSRTTSTVTGPEPLRIRSATSGTSRLTRRPCRPRSWSGAPEKP